MDVNLEKEEAAFYFNQALLNITGLDEAIEKQHQQLVSKKKEHVKKALDLILDQSDILKKIDNFVFNFNKYVTKNARGEIEILLLKLIELRHYYSHYVHNDNVMILSNGEKPILERHYQVAIEATGSETDKLEIMNDNKLTKAGVLFLLCMFLKKSQANKIISSVSGFNDNRDEKKPRRNLFTFYSVREGYKIIPDMEKHFLLFQLVNHLVNQDGYIERMCQSEEIGKGLFFHRIASTFLNVSGILKKMEFYSYQSKRLEEQCGKLEPEKGCFVWVEPFGGNSYFSLDGHRGVIGENQLKELCYTFLVERKNIDFVEGKISQFLERFKEVKDGRDVESDGVLKRDYFPANYFSKQKTVGIKEKVFSRLNKKKDYKPKETVRAYEKMKEVLEFINNSLPAEEKLKQKDFRRYLTMVRFWGKEMGNIKREFDKKGWLRYFPSAIWEIMNLEDIYKFAKKQNVRFLRELKIKVNDINEQEFEKYQQVNDAGGMGELRALAQKFNLAWQEKDWVEYSRQINKTITERQKITIMKQRLTAALKKKHGIENLNLRITTDSDKSRQAVMNRIAIPRGFVKNHIMKSNEKISKKIRQSECPIVLSNSYKKISGDFFNNRDIDKMTEVNGLYEKNILIAFMVVYLMKQLGISLNGKMKLSKLGEEKVGFKISDSVTANISLSQYPSLVYALNREYINKVDTYEFCDNDKTKTILEKIDEIEKERMECVRQILGFEKWLFHNAIIEKTRFADIETHISFSEICEQLEKKRWDKDRLDKLRMIRRAALHCNIPEKVSFRETELLVRELKKEQK